MRLVVVIILLTAIAFFAFIGGLYIAFLYQNQLQVFGQGGILIAISTPIGLAVSLSKFIFDWAREPSLEYGEISPNDEPAFYLRIIKKKKGKAKNCEGFLTVKDTNVTYAASAWSLDARRVIDIGGRMDLRLFRIEGDTIAFPVARFEEGFGENRQSLADFRNRKLEVEIHSDNASVPKPYIATIEDIINRKNQKSNFFRSRFHS